MNPVKEYIQVKHYIASQLKKTTSNKKVFYKKLFLELFRFFYSKNDYRPEYWKHIACLLWNKRFQKKRIYIGKNLHYQKSNEDDLIKNSHNKVFLIIVYTLELIIAVIIYRGHYDLKQIALFLHIYSPLLYSVKSCLWFPV